MAFVHTDGERCGGCSGFGYSCRGGRRCRRCFNNKGMGVQTMRDYINLLDSHADEGSGAGLGDYYTLRDEM